MMSQRAPTSEYLRLTPQATFALRSEEATSWVSLERETKRNQSFHQLLLEAQTQCKLGISRVPVMALSRTLYRCWGF